MFWNAPRLPLLPGGDADLQRAIYEAVTDGSLRLVGAYGTERHVTSASEIGVGQSSLRLAMSLAQETPVGPDIPAEVPEVPAVVAGVIEKQVASALRTSLSNEVARDALYTLLRELADRVDEGAVSYAEVMLKLRIDDKVAGGIAKLIRATGTEPDIRDV